MDQPVRIMPCLDMQNGRVVKGVHFVDIRDAGDPVECARAYCDAGADELGLLDITATVEGRATLLDVVRRVAGVTTVPFTVGGGISDVVASGGAGKLEHFYEAVRAGAAVLLAASVFHFGMIGIGELKDYLRGRSIPVRWSLYGKRSGH